MFYWIKVIGLAVLATAILAGCMALLVLFGMLYPHVFVWILVGFAFLWVTCLLAMSIDAWLMSR